MSGKAASKSELERIVKLDRIPKDMRIEADKTERAALAERFSLPAVHSLVAELALVPDCLEIAVNGTLSAEIEQPCAVSGEIFRNRIEDTLAMRFVPRREIAPAEAEEEIELTAEELDEIEYDGQAFDLGEAIAQGFGLAIDPYAEGPNAQAARDAGLVSSEEASGAFAALAALKKD